MTAIMILLLILKLWLAVGLVFGLVFVLAGLARVQDSARGSGPGLSLGLGLRLILLPGCAIFWPWLGWLWLRRRRTPVECTYHRCAVEAMD